MMLLRRYMCELIINRVDGGASTDLQAGFLDRVFRLPMKFLSGYNKADLMRRFTSMESTRRSFSRMLVTSTMNVVTVVVGLVTLAFYYPIGALAVGLLAALSLAASVTLGRLSMKAYSEGDAMTANVMTIVYELIANMVPIRIFAAERRAFLRWRDNFVEMRRRSVRSTRYSDTFSALQQSMGLLTLGVVFTLVSYYTDNPSSATVGHYVAFVGSISLVTGSVSGLASSILGFFSLQSSMGMSGPLLKELPETRVGRRRLQVSSCEFQLENVEFKYSEDSLPVFENFSLHIQGGEYLGIVGASGCGKSTLLKLLLGIHKPSAGTISIDGVNLADVVMDEARKSFGVVLQDYRMVPGSILENISAGRHLELDAVMAALKTVGLDTLIKSLPMGIHTMVGEGNSMFSGGQMQLMALARALSGEPKLLIFDEATSALDNMSVKKVSDAIDSLSMTRIVFTHRLGTLKNCNRIIVLDRGAIVQEGTYAELSEQPGPFHSMLNGKTD
jgi:ABC-type bacteriocin/lantibiotic exporter with double-glycine peptidase domain